MTKEEWDEQWNRPLPKNPHKNILAFLEVFTDNMLGHQDKYGDYHPGSMALNYQRWLIEAINEKAAREAGEFNCGN